MEFRLPDREEKKKRGTKLAIIIIGILFVISVLYAVNFAGKLHSVNVPHDNPEALIGNESDTLNEKIIIDAASSTMVVKLDKGDLWWIISEYPGTGFVDSMYSNAQSQEIVVDGYGVIVDEKGVGLGIEVTKKRLRLTGELIYDIDIDKNGTVRVAPSTFLIGETEYEISRINNILDLNLDDLIFSFDPGFYFAESIEKIETADGYLLVTVNLYEDFDLDGFRKAIEGGNKKLYDYSLSFGCDPNSLWCKRIAVSK